MNSVISILASFEKGSKKEKKKLGKPSKKKDKLGLLAQLRGGGVGRALECPNPLSGF